MKTFTSVVTFIAFSFFSFNAIAGSSLFMADGTQYQTNELRDKVELIAKELGKEMKSDQGADNFILYVHGRGKEPGKSLDEVIPKLEAEYNAKVIMFHWFPSYKGPLGYPDNEAKASAPDLKQVLAEFNKYKKEHADNFAKIKSILLIHSMGNIVFSQMMESYQAQSFDKNLFDSIILNSADADAKGHDEWVKKIDFSNQIYITVNKNDNVLGLSAKKQKEKRLGQKLETILGKSIPLASNAQYVDFSEIDVNHRYFLLGGQDDNLYLEKFYQQVFAGKAIDWDRFDGIKEIKKGNGNNIYIFKAE